MANYFRIESFSPRIQIAELINAWTRIAAIRLYLTITHQRNIPLKNAKTINQLLKYQWIEAKIREVIIPINQKFPDGWYKKRYGKYLNSNSCHIGTKTIGQSNPRATKDFISFRKELINPFYHEVPLRLSCRRGQDSNLRVHAHIRFPSVRLEPLGHPSRACIISNLRLF